MNHQRTIETILNLTTGEQIEVDELFKDQDLREADIFQLRTEIEKGLQNDKIELVCLYCKQAVAIRGRAGVDYKKHFYFTHPYNSNDCIIKTQNRLSEEQVRCIKYNGEKESELHNTLKRLIGHYLTLDINIENVKIDKVYKDKAISDKWRKPDVLADHREFGTIAFELQLSTTFLSVIVARTLFYQERGIYLIWIFPNFSLVSDLQKFTQKDVFYNNNNNVYVFDKTAQELSNEFGKLMLTCFYKELYLSGEQILSSWEQTTIELKDLHFNGSKKELYFYDAETAKNELEIEIGIIKKARLKIEAEKKISSEIDKIIDYLKVYYKKDWLPPAEKFYLRELVNSPDLTEELNKRLKFTDENIEVITKLFFNRNKPRFLQTLCELDNIHINISKLYKNDKSVFQEIFTIEDTIQFKRYVSYIFRKGYQLKDCDLQLLDNVFDKNCINHTEFERNQIERWALVNLFSKLSNRNLAFPLLSIHKVLLAISSLKYNMIIGFNYSNMKQVAHYIFDNDEEYSTIYLDAIRHFGFYEKLMDDDKTGKLRNRFTNLSNKPFQHPEYYHLVYELFPELTS